MLWSKGRKWDKYWISCLFSLFLTNSKGFVDSILWIFPALLSCLCFSCLSVSSVFFAKRWETRIKSIGSKSCLYVFLSCFHCRIWRRLRETTKRRNNVKSASKETSCGSDDKIRTWKESRKRWEDEEGWSNDQLLSSRFPFVLFSSFLSSDFFLFFSLALFEQPAHEKGIKAGFGVRQTS